MLSTLVLIATCGLVSLLLPCVTPFGALAACAVLRGRTRWAVMVVAATWALNEAAGFTLFGYPRTSESYSWAALQLLAAVLATVIAAAVVHALRERPQPLRSVAALVAGTVSFEIALYVAAGAAHLSQASFSFDIDLLVVATNVFFFVAFEVATLLGRFIATQRRRRER